VALTKFNYNSFDVTTAASKGLAFNSSANGFETSSATSMTLIKTLTASSSSTLSFVDGSSDVVLDNTYPVYMFKFINIHPAEAEHFTFQASTNGGTSYGVTLTSTYFHATHDEGDSSTALAYVAGKDLAQSTSYLRLADSLSTSADESTSGTLHLFDPSNTTHIKHFLSRSSVAATGAKDGFVAGYFNTTSAINAIQFKMSSGNIDSGVIKLYGVS